MPREAQPKILYQIKDGHLYVIGKDVTIAEIKGEMCMAFKLKPEAVDKMIETMGRLRKRL